MINKVLSVLCICKSLQVLCKMANLCLLVKIYYCQVFLYLASLFLCREEKFSPTPCRVFFHAMRLKGCKSFSREVTPNSCRSAKFQEESCLKVQKRITNKLNL